MSEDIKNIENKSCGCDTNVAAETTDANYSNESVQDTEAASCPHCSSRHKERTADEQKALITRLRKVEGQIRGIEKMVESGAYCPDIIVQVQAATAALNSFNKVLLSAHIHSCVAEDIKAGQDDAIDELCKLLQKLMK